MKMSAPKFFAIYGKGGIGKSTIASHISVALQIKGYKVLQIGCDPKHDSTFSLTGELIPTVAEVLSKHDFHLEEITSKEIVFPGYRGVCAVELGGPPAGVGCGGYVIGEGIRLMSELGIWKNFDIIIFDVLGDVVCGGFSVPLQYAQYAAIIATDDFDSIYVANRIVAAIKEKSKMYSTSLIGIIGNKCFSAKILEKFCKDINTHLISIIGHFEEITLSRIRGKTIFELSKEIPPSVYQSISKIFEEIADFFLTFEKTKEITPLPEREIFTLYMKKIQ
jgi:light-independent protochlorophyllide reductase subunit L